MRIEHANNPIKKNLSIITVLLLFGLQSLFLVRCKLPHRLDAYPRESRNLYLHQFTNYSYKSQINSRLNKAVRRELNRRANFYLAKDRAKANLWLEAEIRSYQKKPRFYSRLGQSSNHYDLLMICRVRLSKKDNQTLLLKDFSARVYYSDTEGARETETQASKRLLQIITLRINRALEAAYLESR